MEYEWLELDDDEEILWEGEPVIESIAPSAVYLFTIILAPITLLQYLSIKNTDYVVTNKRIYRKDGVLSESVGNTELHRVQDVGYDQSAIGNALGFGNVSFSTAGGSGDEVEFNAVEDPREIQNLVNEYKEKSTESSTGSEGGGKQEKVDADLDEVVDELKQTRKALQRMNNRLE